MVAKIDRGIVIACGDACPPCDGEMKQLEPPVVESADWDLRGPLRKRIGNSGCLEPRMPRRRPRRTPRTKRRTKPRNGPRTSDLNALHLLRGLHGPPGQLFATWTGRHVDGRDYRHDFKGVRCWLFQFPDGRYVVVPARRRLWGTFKGRVGRWLF